MVYIASALQAFSDWLAKLIAFYYNYYGFGGSVFKDNPKSKAIIPSARVAGTSISIITVDKLLELIREWIIERCDRSVIFRDVHGVIRARNDSQLRMAHDQADAVIADGMPLVWVARAIGFDITRLSGPDLLPAACAYGLALGWRHYFYGSTPAVLENLTRKLMARFPGLIIAGTQSPPFRPLTREEDECAYAAIRAAKPDLVWVGLGSPKQEAWMAAHRGQLGGTILLGVGAAFAINAGLTPRAPKWVQNCCLEWSFRLFHEPKRLWRRYLVFNPIFVPLAIHEVIRHHFNKRFR